MRIVDPVLAHVGCFTAPQSLDDLDDYSVAEIAEVIGTTYRAAESVLARARRAFTTAYEDTQ